MPTILCAACDTHSSPACNRHPHLACNTLGTWGCRSAWLQLMCAFCIACVQPQCTTVHALHPCRSWVWIPCRIPAFTDTHRMCLAAVTSRAHHAATVMSQMPLLPPACLFAPPMLVRWMSLLPWFQAGGADGSLAIYDTHALPLAGSSRRSSQQETPPLCCKTRGQRGAHSFHVSGEQQCISQWSLSFPFVNPVT